MSDIPPNIIVFVCIIFIGAWFLIGEKFSEKIMILGVVAFLFAFYKFLNGPNYQEWLAAFRNLINK